LVRIQVPQPKTFTPLSSNKGFLNQKFFALLCSYKGSVHGPGALLGGTCPAHFFIQPWPIFDNRP
ncbi:MAG: hypothetical protein KC413_05435, partial [Anaerolineales bacterium]|nr:hypothetical protein [Anaerolineales bacterium]